MSTGAPIIRIEILRYFSHVHQANAGELFTFYHERFLPYHFQLIPCLDPSLPVLHIAIMHNGPPVPVWHLNIELMRLMQ
jgi:hypothetical protein